MPEPIRLKIDWDLPLQPPRPGAEPRGHFVGRARERELLANELARSNQRSIFVSGYRGVGKTSLVYRALHDVAAHEVGEDVLLVLLNAAQLEAETDAEDRIVPRLILVNLIRRLYTASLEAKLDDDLRRAIGSLYEKAIASEYSERHQLARAEALQESRDSASEFNLRTSAPLWLSWILCYCLATLLVALPGVGSHPIVRAAALLLAAPIPLTLRLSYRWRRLRTSQETAIDEASRLYAFDASIGNLEFDLEGTHRQLASSGIKAIYVIDELDKLDVELVVNVLKYFKSLFTLSAAIFVFVGSEELARRFSPDAPVEEGIYRPKEYTFFTTQYSLARPDSGDLRAFLSEIFEPDTNVGIDRVDRVKSLLIFEAAGDFFDLRRAIRDRITGFERDVPIVEIGASTEDESLKISLQQSIDVVFDQKYRVYSPSRWTENEEVRRHLYSLTSALARGYVGMTLNDDTADTVAAAAARDLCTLLYRLGALEIAESREEEIRGLLVTLHEYRFIGSFRDAVPHALEFLSEEEEAFVTAFRRFSTLLLEITNIERRLQDRRRIVRFSNSRAIGVRTRRLSGFGLDLESLSEEARAVFSGLSESRPPRAYRREDIERVTRDVNAARVRLEGAAPMVTASLIAQISPSLQATALSEPGVQFGTGRIQQFGATVDQEASWLVHDEHWEKGLLGAPPLRNTALKEYADALRSGAPVYRVLTVGQTEDDMRPKPRGVRAVSWDETQKAGNDRAIEVVKNWLLR